MLLKHTVLYLPAQIVVPTVQIIALATWSHLLVPAEVGFVTLLVAAQEIFFGGAMRWWTQYVLRNAASFVGEARAEFVTTESSVLIAAAIVQCGLIVILSDILSVDGDLIAIATLFAVTRNLCNYASERARAETQIALYSVMQIGGIGAGFFVGLLIGSVTSFDAASVLSGFVVTQTIALAVFMWQSDLARSVGRPNQEMLRLAARFGAPVAGAQFLSTLTLNLPRFIVAHMMGISAAGTFAVAYGIGMRISGFAVMLVTPGAYPLVARKMAQEGQAPAFRQLAQNITAVLLVVIPCALGTLAIHEALVKVIVPDGLVEATGMILPLAIGAGMVRYLRSHATDQVFLLTGDTGVSLAVSLFDALLATVLCVLGTLYFGYAGATSAVLTSGLCSLATSQWLAYRVHGFAISWADFTKILGAGVVMLLAVRAVDYVRIPQGAADLAVDITLGAVVYSLCVVMMFGKRLSEMMRRRAS